MRLLAIDPGNEQSAWLLFDGEAIVDHGIDDNYRVLDLVATKAWGHLAIEMVACYGMAVGREVFDTCVWIGRFIEACGVPYTKVYRTDVKLHLCHQVRAKDANVRQALLDRFGPGKERAVGTKKQPGPLYGIKSHEWAALAVAVTWFDKHSAMTATA